MMTSTVSPQRSLLAPVPDPDALLAYLTMPGDRLLVVDDDTSVRVALTKMLQSFGYEVEAVDSGAAALSMLERQRFALLLCDIFMPEMNGVELLEQLQAKEPALAVVAMTGGGDEHTARAVFARGGYDYLVKPVQLEELKRTVEKTLARRRAALDQWASDQRVRRDAEARAAELERERSALRATTVGVAEALINAMEAKDVFLHGHSHRVAALAASMAAQLRLPPETVEHIRLAGRLHDVGKIGIRESVLNKPARLTDEEFEHVKTHVTLGMGILAPLKHLGVVLTYVHHHHEHWDGRGYPQGLAGEEISLGGRILTAADAFDALTSARAYRDALPESEAFDKLRAAVGSLLEPRVFEALQAVVASHQRLIFIDEHRPADAN